MCKLVKKFNKVNDKTFTNFFLQFDNGEMLPIELKFFPLTSKDDKENDIRKRINHDNYVKLSILAELMK